MTRLPMLTAQMAGGEGPAITGGGATEGMPLLLSGAGV